MARFAGRLVRASTYGIIVGTILSLIFSIGVGIASALSGGTLPINSSQAAVMGFVLGFAAPLAIDLSNQYEETSKK